MFSFLSDTFFKSFSSTVNIFIAIFHDSNISTAEFLVISAETACREKIENSQIFNEDFYLPLYLPLWFIHCAVRECTLGYSDFHNLMGFPSKKMPNNIL